MAWPMPTAGQWNPNMAMPTDMTTMSMGSYTSEQWTAMQQQNWQQWAQWQQQYAQWQTQYGEKYTEQMQAIQAMGGMPPLPPGNAAPPPAPPPPDKPPPPPHENNQPLYGHNQSSSKPAPVPPPTGNQPAGNQPRNNTGNYNNTNIQPGNNSNWSYAPDPIQQQQSSINAEALKKLAEEERLFDIQFKKWEEEIQKWKQENVNHPDKQAYKEYEEKFEACRAQLMERRQQMKLKRARLTGATPQPPVNTNTNPAGNITSAVVPPQPKVTSNNNYPNMQTQFQNNSSEKYSDQGNTQYQRQQYNNQTGYNRGNNQNIDPQDRYESYHNMSDNNYPSVSNANFSAPDNSTFLAKSSSAKGIPGLDLVEGDKPYGATHQNQEVIDISEDHNEIQHQQRAPDYSKISKGINNILGDEKIMNILSMVCVQQTPEGNSDAPNVCPPNAQYGGNNQNDPPFAQGNRNPNYNNQQYDNRQNRPFNRQGPNYPGQNQEVNKYPPQKRVYDERQNDMPQDQYNYNRNAQYGGPEMPPLNDNGPPRNMPPPVRHNMPPPVRPNMPPPVRPNMPGGRPPQRPLIQEMPGPQIVSEYQPNPHERRPLRDNNVNPIVNQPPPRTKWPEEPLFSPSFIVEYEHKPLRLKARDFIEPVHLFEYDHKSKDGDDNIRDFEKEADELFVRKPRRSEKEFDNGERYARDYHSRDYERRAPRDELREDFRSRLPPRDEYDDRRRPDNRFEERRRDDREKYTRREDSHRDRDSFRERGRDSRREDSRDYSRRSRSRERESRKRAVSKDSDISSNSLSKKSKEKDPKPAAPGQPKHVVSIDDLLESPGREMRPSKIVIILRGPPGSGKSYLAKLIRDREAEYGGTVRIMSIDDYFMQEGEIEERDPSTGKVIKKPTLKYEYDEKSEETYMNSLKRAFKRSLTDGYFSFLIYDAVNDDLKSYADIWNFSRQSGFQVYICSMESDSKVCHKRNIHNRKLEDIEVICSRFFPTPAHHIQLDATTLLQSAAIPDVEMEDADNEVIMEDAEEPEVENVFSSKWEKMDDAAQLARLDGTSKPLRPSQLSMEDYLQLDDWTPNAAKPGKKTVRWADIEERREQEKMRAIGFVVGQTDWNRMTDPTMGSSALTQTKYIERVRRH